MRIEGIAKRILMSKPYLAWRMNNYVFRETVYGIVKRLNFLVNHIEAKRQDLGLKVEKIRILDVGCGTGVNVTIPLANIGYSVVGLDTDLATIERARQLSKGISNIDFRKSELSESQFPESFHVVICSEVLEHLKKPEILVQQIYNVLKDNGLILITVPNGYGYFEYESLLERCFHPISLMTDTLQDKLVKKLGWKKIRVRHINERKAEHYKVAWPTLSTGQEHCQRFTLKDIKQILTDQGFNIIEICNRAFLSGNILNSFVRDWDDFLLWNCDIADRLPYWLCSSWMIAASPVPFNR